MTEPHYQLEDLLPPVLVPPEWTEGVPCIGRWEEFDGHSKKAMQVCWNECHARVDCFLSAMDFEAENNYRATWIDNFSELPDRASGERTGIRGGYSAAERELIYLDVVTSDDPSMALYQYCK